MATQTPTMPFGTDEPPHHTPVSDAFPSLFGAVAALIISERDLDDISYSQDPAYGAWLRDAELDQERLTDALHRFHALPDTIPADRPLRRMALLVDTMLGHEDPGGARTLHREMQIAFFNKFQVSGTSATAMHRNGMLIKARHFVTALVRLPLFDTTPEAICDDHPLEESGIFAC